MHDPTGIFVVVAFVALIVMIIVFGAMAAAKRRKELTAWAAAHGLQFDESKDSSTDERFPAFSCLREGDHRYSFNHLRGPWGKYEFLGFDYHYETHSTDSKGHRQTHDHHFSAVIFTTPWMLKPLFIRPEGLMDKITAFFGANDIDFESTEFSKKFFVKSPDKKWAYDVLHARTMQFLLDSPRYHLQFEGHYAIAWNGSIFKTQEFEAAAAVPQGILDALPDYLVKELQAAGVA